MRLWLKTVRFPMNSLVLLRLLEHITLHWKNYQATGDVLLDVVKAFDKVWYQDHIYKLMHGGIDSALVYDILIASFLSGQKFEVKLDGSRSTETSIEGRRRSTAGLRHGPNSLHFLWTRCISTVPPLITPFGQLMLYADDTAKAEPSSDACSPMHSRPKDILIRTFEALL